MAAWYLRVQPGLQYKGKPLTLWARIRIWEWRIKREMIKEGLN